MYTLRLHTMVHILYLVALITNIVDILSTDVSLEHPSEAV